MLINMFNPTFAPDLVTKTRKWIQDTKVDHLIQWSIMRIFNEAEPL